MHPHFRNLLTLKAAGILQEIEDISTNEVILMSTWWSCRTNVRPVSRPWGSRWRREYFYFLFGACGMCIWYYLKLKSWKNLLLSRSTIVSEEKLFSMYMYLSYLLKKRLRNQIYLGPKDPGSAIGNCFRNYFVSNHSLGLPV